MALELSKGYHETILWLVINGIRLTVIQVYKGILWCEERNLSAKRTKVISYVAQTCVS